MKTLLFGLCLFVCATSSLLAQESVLLRPVANEDVFTQQAPSRPSATATYDSQETPQQRVHRNAALKAAQRRQRMAINARFGYSPSRPPASPMPSMGSPIPSPLMLRAYYTPYPGMSFPRANYRF